MSDLGLSCPYGGDFYICQGAKVEFVGCCTSNPCSDGSGFCDEKKLRPSSFSMTQYAKIPALACDDSQPRIQQKPPLFYTCINPTPPFLGCCFSNPCGDGCPQANVSAARLPDEASTRQMFLTNANANQDSQNSKLSGGAIAGIVIGAVAVIAALIGAYWFMRRRKQKETAVENVLHSSEGLHHSDYKGSPNINNHSPNPSAASPHSGYGYPHTPPQAHGFQNGYQTVPSELGHQDVAELSAMPQGEIAMLDSTPVGHHQTHSPTIPPSASTVTSGWQTGTTATGGWPTDNKK